jgi:hypothetical protein
MSFEVVLNQMKVYLQTKSPEHLKLARDLVQHTMIHGRHGNHSLLTWSAREDCLELTRILVQESYVTIDDHTLDNYKDTALSWYAYHGNVLACEFLFQCGADINIRDGNYNYSAVMWALMRHHVHILYWALRKPEFDVHYVVEHKGLYYYLFNHNIMGGYPNATDVRCVHLLLDRGCRDIEHERRIYQLDPDIWRDTFGTYFAYQIDIIRESWLMSSLHAYDIARWLEYILVCWELVMEDGILCIRVINT